QQAELREELRRHAGAGLVAGIEIVAERLDDVVGGDAEVADTRLEQTDDRAEHTACGRDRRASLVVMGRHCEVVTEQLVRAVEQVNAHYSCTSSISVPNAAFGCTNATVVPRDPGRGASSITLPPASFTDWSAAAQSATR